MTGLRFIEKEVPDPANDMISIRVRVLQFHHDNFGWLDVPVVMEDQPSNNKDTHNAG